MMSLSTNVNGTTHKSTLDYSFEVVHSCSVLINLIISLISWPLQLALVALAVTIS